MPVELDQVSYTYAPGTVFEAAALDRVTVSIEDGEFVGIMGHTGCGKSTMIQLIAGLLVPSSGKVLLDGCDINDGGYRRGELRKRVGIVFQYPEYQLFESTVEKDVAFGLKHLALNSAEVRSRVAWALETVGLNYGEICRESSLGLSGGEKRKVAIAGVLAMKPQILILDEPIAGLDPVARDSFMQLLDRLHNGGTTIIIVSHNADILGDFTRRILVLNKGSLVMDGAVKDVFSDVAQMEALNLDVSRPRKIAHLLGQRGVAIPQDIVRYEELLTALTHLKKSGGLP
ncbi:MAG: energy-coupling factor transporter ATPase [Peptococcaceae bacterium]|nr:energy-coupling factor transporter ATPase [Peptococcaceae bacterium]